MQMILPAVGWIAITRTRDSCCSSTAAPKGTSGESFNPRLQKKQADKRKILQHGIGTPSGPFFHNLIGRRSGRQPFHAHLFTNLMSVICTSPWLVWQTRRVVVWTVRLPCASSASCQSAFQRSAGKHWTQEAAPYPEQWIVVYLLATAAPHSSTDWTQHQLILIANVSQNKYAGTSVVCVGAQ